MRFVLHYRGPLRANGNRAHKHELRQHFHTQLSVLWGQQPLSEMRFLREPRTPGMYCLLRPLSRLTFVPLVTKEMDVVAELAITFLRPEPPGSLITQGGDIDNRLKTLFDALTMPRDANALPADLTIDPKQPFFYCLLEDDNLVTAVSVRTDQLLEPVSDKSHVDLTVSVRTRVTRETIGNSIFA